MTLPFAAVWQAAYISMLSVQGTHVMALMSGMCWALVEQAAEWDIGWNSDCRQGILDIVYFSKTHPSIAP